MKKRWMFLGLSFVVVLVAGLVLTFSSSKLVSFNDQVGSFALFSQSTLGSGDSYYEERCVDVSQYYALGYGNARVDAQGCQIVSKVISTTVVSEQLLDYGCETWWGNPCSRVYGANWVVQCSYSCRAYGSNGACDVCRLYSSQVDEKGGFERVLNYCVYDQNDLLVAETFAGGQSITKNSLRYPMKAFCRAHPSIVTDDALKQYIPQDLIDGKSVSISSGQTLTVFYTIENNANLPTICTPENNLALDVNNPTLCKSTLGFTYLCSEGQFDALSGTCVVQPESKTLCSQGRYDVNSGLCIFNPPLQVDCGSNNCFYSVDRQICSCSVKQEFTCDLGFTLSQPIDEVECITAKGDWLLCPECPSDKICSSDICTPRCSIGQKCVWSNPLVQDCIDANATIFRGQCVINGTTLDLCPDTTTYNSVTKLCQFTPDTIAVCDDGSQPLVNALTGKSECITTAPKFFNCADDEVLSNGFCVKQITVYVPDTKTVTIYQQIKKDCSADSDCGSTFTCNTNNGYCQTPIYYKTNYTPIYISSVIVVLGLIVTFIMLKAYKKRGRRR
jgi:hypothetical protein